MGTLTIADAYRLATDHGATHDAAVTAVAIAIAESGLDPGAIGDVALETPEWGPSVGLWQVRSLVSERGTGAERDGDRLTDPAFNAASAAAISAGWTNFKPWSTFVSGEYTAHLAKVQAAIPLDAAVTIAAASMTTGAEMITAHDPRSGLIALVDEAGETFWLTAQGTPAGDVNGAPAYLGGLNTHPDWQAGEGKAQGPCVAATFVDGPRSADLARCDLLLITRNADGFHPWLFPCDGSLRG